MRSRTIITVAVSSILVIGYLRRDAEILFVGNGAARETDGIDVTATSTTLTVEETVLFKEGRGSPKGISILSAAEEAMGIMGSLVAF